MMTPKGKVLQIYPHAVCAASCGSWHVWENRKLDAKPIGEGRSGSSAWLNASHRLKEEVTTDPKGSEGSKKAPLHFLPAYPLHETSWVLKTGAEKYGPYSWRKGKVCASTYRSAMQRHLDQWFDGLEDADEETGRSHLAHVMASAMIVLDAMKHGTLEDDRPRLS